MVSGAVLGAQHGDPAQVGDLGPGRRLFLGLRGLGLLLLQQLADLAQFLQNLVALLARQAALIVGHLGRQRQRREQRCVYKKLLHWLPNSFSGSACTGCPECVLSRR